MRALSISISFYIVGKTTAKPSGFLGQIEKELRTVSKGIEELERRNKCASPSNRMYMGGIAGDRT
jgi:hypothetical protein